MKLVMCFTVSKPVLEMWAGLSELTQGHSGYTYYALLSHKCKLEKTNIATTFNNK